MRLVRLALLLILWTLPAPPASHAAPLAQAGLPPAITTDPVSNLTSTSATLNATVNPNGSPTTVQFLWGTDPIYDVRTTPARTVTGTTAQAVQAPLTDLQPGTTYFVQAIARNATGSAEGLRRTITTTGDPQQGADLSVAQLDSPDATIGKPITYTATIRNAGPLTAAATVLTATVPISAQIISSNPSFPTCSPLIYVFNELRCTLGNLPAGARRTVQFVVIASQAGNILSTVSVASRTFDPNRLNNTDRLTTRVNAAPPNTTAELLVTPERGGTLHITNTQGLTLALVVPPRAVIKPTSIIYTDFPAGPPRPLHSSLTFAGRAFQFDTFQDGVIQPEFRLLRPATLTVQYDRQLVPITATEYLLLLRYNLREPNPSIAWQTFGITTQTVRGDLLHTQLPQLGEFALVILPPTRPVAYLPLVRRLP
ncbi:MAG: DUF11 domain-containing protein [Chloroflexaceae bacterium]|nr:DUF11 domain-containing protein [Chloroflexaceae bacterium]